MIPGSNLLSMALGVIRPQAPMLRVWLSRTRNEIGVYVNTYADAVPILGSFQPVDRKAYQQLGLDLSRNYSILYTSTPVRVVQPDGSADLVEYAGKTHQAESAMDWQAQDGWRSYTFVEVQE